MEKEVFYLLLIADAPQQMWAILKQLKHVKAFQVKGLMQCLNSET